MFDAGIRVHPSTPASARLAPSSFMKLRRVASRSPGPKGPGLPPSPGPKGPGLPTGPGLLAPRRRTISSRGTLNAGLSSMARRAREQALDIVARHAVAPRRPVTLHAPLHRQRRGLIDLAHRVHGTVAGMTVDAVLHVNRVVEEDEIRHARDALPRNRLARGEAPPDRGEQVRCDRRVVMARYACGGRRQPRHRGAFRTRMTVAAVDLQPIDVKAVRERHRLTKDPVLTGRGGRSRKRPGGEREGDD